MTTTQFEPWPPLPVERDTGTRRSSTMPRPDPRDDDVASVGDEFCTEWQVEGTTLTAPR